MKNRFAYLCMYFVNFNFFIFLKRLIFLKKMYDPKISTIKLKNSRFLEYRSIPDEILEEIDAYYLISQLKNHQLKSILTKSQKIKLFKKPIFQIFL